MTLLFNLRRLIDLYLIEFELIGTKNYYADGGR